MNRFIVIAAVLSFLFLACGRKGESTEKESGNFPVGYATGFSVHRAAGYTVVEVRDPWDAAKILQRYVLVPAEKELPSELPQGVLVRTPLKRVVAATSVHCGWLDMLGVREELVGVCESRYIDVPFVKQGLEVGQMIDIGEAAAPDVERLIELAPDGMITSPLSNAPYGRVEKTGIPQVKCVDYMEPTPLGRAEWIRFLALFFDREALADSLFAETVKAYEEVKALVREVKECPTVVMEMKYGGMWYVSGGQSYMGCLLRDAGAAYCWADDAHAGSFPLSFEAVFEKGGEADFWLIKYNRAEELGYDGLRKEYAPYANFEAWKKRHIFTCNTGVVSYYEEVPIRPDYLLKDFVKIFHPHLLPDYRLRYYRKMKEE